MKKIIHHDKAELILGMQGWFNIWKSINNTAYKQKPGQKSQIHLSRFGKTANKIQHPFIGKALMKLEIEGSDL
jgi:hypothetical protein